MNKLLLALVIGLLALSTPVDAACTAASDIASDKGCCCAANGSSQVQKPGVDACVSACTTTEAVGAATSCLANYYLDNGSCTACAQGKTAPAASTAATACVPCDQGKASLSAGAACTDATSTATPATGIANGCRVFALADKSTCSIAQDGYALTSATATDPCPIGQYSTNGGSCTGVTTVPTTGHLANCRSFSSAAATTCVVAKNGFHVVSGTVTPCDQDQYSLNGGACTATTGTATTANADCRSYEGADKSTATCASAKAGKVLVSGAFRSCVANCDECDSTTPATNPTAATCTKAKAGFYIEQVTASGTTTKSVKDCSTDKLCAACTYTPAAGTTAAIINCTAAVAGSYLDGTTTQTAKACDAGQGSVAGNMGDATTCAACNAAKNCTKCTTVEICTACKAGYVYNAAPTGTATECTLFDVTQKHVTCKTASAEGEAGCNECDAADFRAIETEIVAPATTATAQAVGQCMCMSGYAEAATVAKACVSCGDTNATSCTINATGGITITACKADFFIAGKGVVGNKCLAKALTGIVGFFWDSVQSEYAGCHATCSKCTAGTDSSCSECVTPGTSWAAPPAEGAAGFDAYLKTYWLNASKCFNACPTDYVADEAQTACVAGSAGNSVILSIALVITIIVSILF